jgi:beta-glucosidase
MIIPFPRNLFQKVTRGISWKHFSVYSEEVKSNTDQADTQTKFPKDFLWGASTSAYQVEGGIENNDWAQAAREGKFPPAGKACDHYNRFEEDFTLARTLGHNAHRFSIEWARIEPREGEFDAQAIEHYRQVLVSLRQHGLEPFVNLWHYTVPVWFAERGGFEHKDAEKVFARYCSYVVQQLGSEAKFWLTLNEPMVFASGAYLRGKWPPFQRNFFMFMKIQSCLVSAHNQAYDAIKAIAPHTQIGIAKNNMYFASDGWWWNDIAKYFMDWFWNERFLNAIDSHQDFIGLNHYFYKKFGKKEKLPQSDRGWDIFPEAIYHCIMELTKYHKPIYISEHGIADAADTKRGDFITNYLRFVKRAIDEGAPVRGYFHWSLLDNFELEEGFTKKFGLIALDPSTLDRTIRPSAFVYKHIIESRSIS